MQSIKNVYTRKMSGIANLQDESEIMYNLLETEAEGRKMYGIQLICRSRAAKRTDELPEIAPSEKNIRDLLTLLYENAIMIDVWRDIVSDVVLRDLI